jgi:hypothetical protein
MLRDYQGLLYWCEHDARLPLILMGLQIRDVRRAAMLAGDAVATAAAAAADITHPGAGPAIAGFRPL